MPIKVLFLGFYPETSFQSVAAYLLDNGIGVCGFASTLGYFQQAYQQHKPDIICYEYRSIPMELYAHELPCKLLAVAEVFNLDDHAFARACNEDKIYKAQNICGYVVKRNEFLLTAIRLVHAGETCFYTNDEFPRL